MHSLSQVLQFLCKTNHLSVLDLSDGSGVSRYFNPSDTVEVNVVAMTVCFIGRMSMHLLAHNLKLIPET